MNEEKVAVEEARANRTTILPEGTYDLDSLGGGGGRSSAVRMQAIGAVMWLYRKLMKEERQGRADERSGYHQ